MLWLIIAAIFAFTFYKLWKMKNFWKDRNIPHKEPVLFFGHILDNFLRRKSFFEIIDEIYAAFPDARFVGFSQTTTPILFVRHPETIKQICIKDFEHFAEHQALSADESIDPLWYNNLFAAKAPRWRELRPMLSPTFTSSKMKLMFNLMDDTAQRFVEYFKTQEEQSTEVELKDIFSRFTNDVIATTAFGIECNSLQSRKNEFYLMGKDITNFTGLRSLKFFALMTFPRLVKLLGMKVFPPKSAAFFVDVIDTTLREREQRKIIRPDLINLLLEARKGDSGLKHDEQNEITQESYATVEESAYGKPSKHKELSDVDVYAQCLIFFFAGFDTVSNALTLAIYELALNADIQDRLRKEIDEVWEECKGQLNYEVLNKMRYMDMVVSESLRKWAPAVFTDRRCTKPYTIPPVLPNETPIKIEVGQLIGVPIRCIHLDEKYFPNPTKFDPERFNDENKHNIKPGTYMPFGIGPRNCIGSRFALLEMKTILFHLLHNFEVVPNKKTQVPLIPNKTSFNFVGEKGTWVDFKRR